MEKEKIDPYFQRKEVIDLLDEIPQPIMIIEDGKYIQCNDAAVILFHAGSKSDLIGTGPLENTPRHQPDGTLSADYVETIKQNLYQKKILKFDWLHKCFDKVLINTRIHIKHTVHEEREYLVVTLINNTNQAKIIGEVLGLADDVGKGNLRTRLNTDQYSGDLGDLAHDINRMLDSILFPFRDIGKSLFNIEKGDLDSYIATAYEGEHEHFRVVVNGLAKNLKNLETEIEMITSAAKEGKLSYRGDANNFDGEYSNIIVGINEMLNAILAPVRESNRILSKIKGGDLSTKMEMECRGDHANIKNSINAVHDWLVYLINYVTCIADGDMSADIEKASDKDDLYIPLTRMRDNIRLLVTDVKMLASAGIQGDLEVRVDSSKHLGDFKVIVDGINDILDSVIIPVQETMRVADFYASYNFSERVDRSKPFNGQWSQFRDSLDMVGVQVSDVVKLIDDQIGNLNTITEVANAGVKDISRGAAALAQNAQVVSTQADEGGDGIRDVLTAMEGLAVSVSDVSSRTDEVNRLAANASELAANGSKMAKNAERGMVEITKTTTEVDILVHDIADEMARINKITHVITDIANQTNLLALNAAIEAARAGEMGRGFAVVAAEVKSLAQESRKSAENITTMISSLQKKMETASDTMDKSSEVVKDGGTALKDALDVFGEITTSVETISTRIDEVATSSEQQAAVVEEITASMHEVGNRVKKTAQQSVDAAAATEETSAAIDQIVDMINEVHKVSGSLTTEMKQFQI